MTPTGPRRILVTGAGGFIGHALAKRFKAEGHWVRGVDLKRPEFERSPADEFLLLDLREEANCHTAVHGVDDVYQLAADMGGIGYITSIHASLTRNNALINAHMLEASADAEVDRYLYTSSACVYPAEAQNVADVAPLKESDAIPAHPEKGYGWEKLFSEQLTTYFHEERGLDVRIVRFHNIYGPLSVFEGGREKAPAAVCRKVAEAEDGNGIEVWGDGQQTRSFCFIDDCVEGITRIMASGFNAPINLGTDEMVSVDALVDLVTRIGRKQLHKIHDPSKPQGVRGRNSDNSLLLREIGWAPEIPLEVGLARTYSWVWGELKKAGRARPPIPAQSISEPISAAVATPGSVV
ncbi:MAG: NAD-dependent epimerase/dehydratase family protein [Thermoplasmata archaeon]|nr:NAD-dependent epimerase/dehydratase family protein [Thermoplasmata archaeon]